MAMSVQELLENLNLKTIDISKLGESRGLYFVDAFVFNAENVNGVGCVFYRCMLVGVGFDQLDSLFVDCRNRVELTIKDVCELYKGLINADLSGADLEGANLYYAKLQSANLKRANLRDANLKGADLDGANLQSAILQDASYSSATSGLTEQQKAGMRFVE